MPEYAVIFDMDGVLVDSEPIHKKADVEAFRSVGLEIPVAVLQEYAGVGGGTFFASILERFGAKGDPDVLRAEKNRILIALLQADAPPVPGIHGLLGRVDALGWRKAVASSSDVEVVNLVLDRLGMRTKFEPVVTGGDVKAGKPAPDIFLRAAKLLVLPPANCLVIEDSQAGVRGAAAAGMACIGLANPLSGTQDLSSADAIVSCLDEIDAGLLRTLLSA